MGLFKRETDLQRIERRLREEGFGDYITSSTSGYEEPKKPLIINHRFNWLGLVGVIFVVAKLLGYVTWPWWIVLSPFWIGIAATIGFLLILGAIALVVQLCISLALGISKLVDKIKDEWHDHS